MAPVYVAELQRLAVRGVRLLKGSEEQTSACDEACMAIWRRTENHEGVGIMRWGGYDSCRDDLPTLIDDFNFSNHKWRLGVRCFNTTCVNSSNVTLI